MNKPLTNLFELQIKSLTGFDFQNIVIDIMQFYYGITDFTDIRPQKDKGCDGIIESEKRVIACYGTTETSNTNKRQREFLSKIKSDYKLYNDNWKISYQNWSIVINHFIDPYYDIEIKKLDSNATIIGLNQIINMVEALKYNHKRLLSEKLGIDINMVASDFIKEFLEDMLTEDYNESIDITYKPKDLIELSEKIELNFSEHDYQGIKDEYSIYLINGLFKQINSQLYSYEDKEIDKIKVRLINDYRNNSNGDFASRLQQLTNFYCCRYSTETDDYYFFKVRGLLLYLFEQCLIGSKTEGEK